MDLLLVFIPKHFVVAGVVCLAAGLVLGARLSSSGRKDTDRAVLLGCWVLLPTAALFTISRFTPLKIFLDYYLITIVPGVVLLLAHLLRSCSGEAGGMRGWLPLRAVLVTMVVAVSMSISLLKMNWISLEDWRAASRTAREFLDSSGAAMPVFFDSGLIESKQIDWLTDPAKASYLLAPLAAYPLATSVLPLPFSMEDTGAKQYALELLQQVPGREFMLIGRRADDEFRMEKAFVALATGAGYSRRYLYHHPKEGRPFILLFERSAVPAANKKGAAD